jgi:hypothetical protein
VQRWPVGLSSSLAYTFSVDGAQQQHNTLNINVTDSDETMFIRIVFKEVL